MGNCIDFENAIKKTKRKLKANQEFIISRGNILNMGSYNIMTYISLRVTLVQVMDYLCNVNHAISVVRYWIFDSNYEKSLVLNI